jgi:hypothetical protein
MVLGALQPLGSHGDVHPTVAVDVPRGRRLDGKPKALRSDTKHRVQAGDVFGRLTVLEDGAAAKSKILCRCDCGAEKPVQVSLLINGHARSCGCWQRKQAAARSKAAAKHGHAPPRAADSYARFGGGSVVG